MDSGYKCWWLCWKQEHILEKSTGKLILLGFNFILGRKFSASHDRKKATENMICTNDWTKIYTPSQNGEAPTCAEHSHILKRFRTWNWEENCDVTKFKFVKLWDWSAFTRKRRKSPLAKNQPFSENWRGDISTFMLWWLHTNLLNLAWIETFTIQAYFRRKFFMSCCFQMLLRIYSPPRNF